MKKRNLSFKEEDQLQKFKRENKSLKIDVARLRKELEKLHIRYSNLDDAVQAQYEETVTPKARMEDLKKKWACHKCKEGHLKLVIINRMDGTFYIRKCNLCPHKTRLKKYTENVEGIT